MKRVILIVIFLLAIISVNACKSSSSCTLIEKQEINNNQTNVVLETD